MQNLRFELKITTHENQCCVQIPEETNFGLAYIQVPKNASVEFYNHKTVNVNILARRGLSLYEGERFNSLTGPGNALLSIGTEDQDDLNCHPYDPQKFAPALNADADINCDDSNIRAISEDIARNVITQNGLQVDIFARDTANWIDKNIKYSLVPQSVISRVAEQITRLGPHSRIDMHRVLMNSFGTQLNNQVLTAVASQIRIYSPLSPNSHELDLASHIMQEACRIEPRLSTYFWSDVSARNTLNEKSGKCINIANLYAAINRAAGIPTRVITGLFDDGKLEESHAWNSTYIPRRGWVQSDPTNLHLGRFNIRSYWYDLCDFYNNDVKINAWKGTCFESPEVNRGVLNLLDLPNNHTDANKFAELHITSSQLADQIRNSL